MPHIIFPEYRDERKLTKYPFTDTSTLTSTEGNISIPEEIFCDASIYMPGAVPPIYIQRITVTDTDVSVTVSDYSKRVKATGIVKPREEVLSLYNAGGHQVGILVASTDLTYFTLTNLPKGEHEFTSTSASFVPRCIIPLKDTGVTSIGVEGGEQLYGDVWLVGKDGIIVRYVDNAIRFDIVGDPLFKRFNASFEPPKFVKTINGQPPDEYGTFRIAVAGEDADILRIDSSTEGIKIYAAGV